MPISPAVPGSLVTVHIDLERIRANVRQLPLSPERLMPVIKSDAYGHGMLAVAHVLHGLGVRHFAVGTVAEAVLVRQAGLDQCVVPLLGAVTPDEARAAQAHGITPLVFGEQQLRMLAAQTSYAQPLDIAVKFETGMGRLGFAPQDVPALLDALRAAPWVRPVLALSHLSCADMPEEVAWTREQAGIFFAMCDSLRGAFPALKRSLCNSPATVAYPEFHAELARPGIALYGGNPFHGTDWQHRGTAFAPAMSVSAPVLHIHALEAGQSVSYGRMYRADGPRRVAVLAVGYADGFARVLSGRASVGIGGHRAPLLGRVCMGMVMADVSDIPTAALASISRAWIMGTPADDAGAPTLQELATVWGTIPYEVLCLLGRNNRVYTHA